MNNTLKQSSLVLFFRSIPLWLLVVLPWWYLLSYGLAMEYFLWLCLWSTAWVLVFIREALKWSGTIFQSNAWGIELSERKGFFKNSHHKVPWHKVSGLAVLKHGFFDYLLGLSAIQVMVIGQEKPLEINYIKGGLEARKKLEGFINRAFEHEED